MHYEHAMDTNALVNTLENTSDVTYGCVMDALWKSLGLEFAS